MNSIKRNKIKLEEKYIYKHQTLMACLTNYQKTEKVKEFTSGKQELYLYLGFKIKQRYQLAKGKVTV